MAKATREELQAQLAALDEEDNVELWVEDPNGMKTKLTGNRAKTWLQKLGLGEEEPDDEDGGDDPEPDPAPKSGYFGRKG